MKVENSGIYMLLINLECGKVTDVSNLCFYLFNLFLGEDKNDIVQVFPHQYFLFENHNCDLISGD